MGFEYKIHLPAIELDWFDPFIRNSPFFVDYDSERRLYNLCLSGIENRACMPDAWAALETDGIYFCDNCSSTPDVMLQMLIEEAKKYSTEIILEEL